MSDNPTMKALVRTATGVTELITRPRPTIQHPADAIIRITHASICGTDVHVRDGVHDDTSQIGRILGHEGIGYVDEIGSSVEDFQVGDRVIVSCITSCGSCAMCRRSMPGHCSKGGWQMGNSIDGMQAEYTRCPYADGSLHRIPEDADPKSMVMLSDVFTSGFECGVLRGNIQPGSTVAIIGLGPVGLAALITAQLYSPSLIIAIDIDTNRLRIATELGADYVINPSAGSVSELVLKLTDGKGCDTVIEAVGFASTVESAQDLVALGGTIANVGVHSQKASLHLEKLWVKNISFNTQLNDSTTTQLLLKMLLNGKLKSPLPMFTHTFLFKDIVEGYQTFCAGSTNGAIKLLIEMLDREVE